MSATALADPIAAPADWLAPEAGPVAVGRGLSRLFRVMLGLLAVAVLVLDFVYIPFHAADDEEHFALAYTTAHFHLVPEASPDPLVSSGSYVDAAIPGVIERNWHAVRLGYKPVAGHTAFAGREVFHPLPASVYVRLIYLPQVVAIRAAEALDGTVETAITAARIANGLAALALVAIALAFLPETLGLLVLVLLCLPKMMQLFASNSADPVNHGIVLLILAFFCRAQDPEWQPRARHFALAGLGLFAVAGVRPPLAALGLPLFALAWRRGERTGMALTVVAVSATPRGWAGVLPQIHDVRTPVTGSLAEKLVAFATTGPQLLGQSLVHRGGYYLATFVGEMGYGDARSGQFYAFPAATYAGAAIMLGLAGAALGDGRWRIAPPGRASLSLAAAAIVFGLFLSMYVGCTNLGDRVIAGVQGRYFVTPVMLLAMVACATMAPREAAAARVRQFLPLFLVFNLALTVGLGIELYWRW